MKARVEGFGNRLLSVFAGLSAFALTLMGFVVLGTLDQQIAASLVIGLFALVIVRFASERPNSGHARAVSALIDRLMAVDDGDLTSPAPEVLRRQMPALAGAVDRLFQQVRLNLEDVNAMALHDPVTSLPNRLHFRRDAERILAERAGDDRTALLFIDLDGFKEVNDRFGHARGDQVLVLVANRLRTVLGTGPAVAEGSAPLLARLAGDEFTILLPGIGSRAEARRVAEHALEALSEPFDCNGQNVAIGASIGVALCPADGIELTPLMKAADIAMYRAKTDGRGRVCAYEPALAMASQAKARTETDLRHALHRGEFELAYQPQVRARTGSVIAGEALIRWNHPSGEVRLPDSFIGIAEESSLILDIGEWVLDAAADALGRWKTAGMAQRMTFNVSPRQLERPDFFARLRAALARSGSPPWLLELEFTETMVMQCDDAIVAELCALRTDGVSIAIDDFGSGYSNLSRMRAMPLDRVKLDRSLVTDVDTSEAARNVVSAVIHLIHSIGCEAVAEGVERSEQLDVLRAVGCDAIQGFSLAGPMSEAEFTRWVGSRRGPGRLARAS